MKKNLRSMIETYQPDTAQCLVDVNQHDLIESSGMLPDLAHKKSAHMTAAWKPLEMGKVSIPMGGSDLSGWRYLTFSAFSVCAEGLCFRLMFDNSADGEGKGGYACELTVEKDGWNDYRIELPFMHNVGEAQGWNNVGSITLEAVVPPADTKRKSVLYFDNLFVLRDVAAPLFTKMPELKGAALFSKTGNFTIIDRKRIANSIDGAVAKPFEADGILWLPMAPVAAGIAHSTVVDNRALTLNFTYRRKKYVFSATSDQMTVDGEAESLGFYPKAVGGTLFFPADFVREFFRWRQIYTDPMGLVVLSNRKNIFRGAKDAKTVWQLVADLTFLRPDGEKILSDLRRRFPNPTKGRLLFSYEELMQLRRSAKENGELAEYLRALKDAYGTSSRAFGAQPISVHLPRTASALTAELGEAADKILAFTTLYRVTGDKKYCERAAEECEALAEFSDWNSELVSSLGTVCFSVALCYDWCHHVWSESRKAVIERAMLRNGMRVGLEMLDGKRKMWIQGGTAAAVIDAGLLAMALALADVYPETALKLLNRILRNVEPCFASYAPDGGYSEGIAAWEKSFRSLSLIIAMLKRATGDDYGLFSAPGFAATAYFPICTETANGAWNYHNTPARPIDTSMMFWLSGEAENPLAAWMRRQQLLSGQKQVHPFDILFYTPVDDTMAPRLPMDAVYRKAGLAIMRSGWGKEDLFLGLHGGSNRAVNGDLDAGSVILEAGGVRFFSETGGIDSLSIMLRRRAKGQNTIVVNPTQEPAPDQNPNAEAKLTEMKGSAERVYAVVDMTSTNDAITKGKRGVMLTDGRKTAVIQDELVLAGPGEILWTVYTPAAVTLCGGNKAAKLEKDGKTLLCKIGGLGQAKFAAEPVDGCDLTRLYIKTEVKERVRLSVACSLLSEGETHTKKLYDITPISAWGE
ncbi:MAG: hypothetical protein IJX13_05860 [Clostridia bacterium]|nr:hypothetical protein [Clostridia bacterium]